VTAGREEKRRRGGVSREKREIWLPPEDKSYENATSISSFVKPEKDTGTKR
jgi:hypothetical protein